MSHRLRRLAKEFAPPALIRIVRRLRGGGLRFRTGFVSWEAALAQSSGYDAKIILQHVRRALLQVKDGSAVAERDSVLLTRPEYQFPLLAAVLKTAAASDCKVNVLDFGGSLGSTYFQFKSFFRNVGSMCWGVVEQPLFVAEGQREFQSDELRFYQSVSECMEQQRPDVILLSGVLQYLGRPYTVLDELIAQRVKCVVVDRTPCIAGPADLLTVQTVPPQIYPASYPCWLLSEEKLVQAFARGYHVCAEFPALDGTAQVAGRNVQFKGWILEREE